jgi:tetratricopeptide (TPR) repeat protein
MGDSFGFSDVLRRYARRAGYTPGQLARLAGVPKMTVVNWLDGRVQKPRGRAKLLKLATVLHLNEAETSELLQAAGYPAVAQLMAAAQNEQDERLLALLTPWALAKRPPADPSLTEPVPFQAIADLATFVGREAELEALSQSLLGGGPVTIYSLQGMAGVGKTALAARLAYRLRSHFPDGVLWARVDLSDTMSILSTFAHSYGRNVSQYTDIDSRSRVVRELLAAKRALIVLDSAESSEAVKPLLPPTGACAVLITTRHHNLAVARGAHRFEIGPFQPDSGEALALFGRILGEAQVRRERPWLLQIADLLGYLPLAIDIVACRLAYEPGWSAPDFLERLRHNQLRLAELAYEDQSVRLSLDVTYELLPVDLQQCLMAAAVFDGADFSGEALAYLLAEVAGSKGRTAVDRTLDKLRRLYTLSLVQQGRPGRFRLHPLVRDYARAQITDPAFSERMVAYFVNYTAVYQRDFGALELEQENILAALTTAADKALLPGLIQGVNALYGFLESRGLYTVTLLHLNRAAAAARASGDNAGLALALRHLGRIAERHDEYERAEGYYQESVELLRDLDDRENLSTVLRALGILAAHQGDLGLAEAYYQEGLTLARDIQQHDPASDLLRGLGVQAFMRGDYVEAEALYEEGITLTHASGVRERRCTLLWALGLLARDQEELAEAEIYFSEALALAREVGRRDLVVTLLRDLALLDGSEGRYEQAAVYLEEAVALARDLGHPWQINRVLTLWGELRLEQARWSTAAAAFSEVWQQAQAVGNREMMATALFGLARVAAAQGERQEAVAGARRSLAMFEALGHHRALEVKEWLGEVGTAVNNK